MSDDLTIPIVEEEATILKRSVETERVSVRTLSEEEQVLVHDEVRREHVEITRVPKDEEVAEAPAIRTEGDVTIVPVLEERLVVEKRLFLVEELHLRRAVEHQAVELPTTLRRTRVEIEREDLEHQEKH
jgi:stress response protein YsnF